MKVKSLIIPSCLVLSACGFWGPKNLEPYVPEALTACPTVGFDEGHQKIIQKEGHKDAFLIEIIGHEGHCYYDENTLKDKAVASPRIRVKRLSDTNVEDVHFSYYIRTHEGPANYLGKKTYFDVVYMSKGIKEVYYTPAKGELSIPAGKYDPDLYVGLEADKSDLQSEVK